MKQLYYAYQYILRSWREQSIKVVSLAVGVLVSMLLFARVAFELNYDSFYPETENLFMLQCSYADKSGMFGPSEPYVYGKMPGALLESFPDYIESATVIRTDLSSVLFNGEQRYADCRSIYADEHLFATTGVALLSGNAESLLRPRVIFLSQTLARQIFGDTDPLNKTLVSDKTTPMTVGGVFEDIPENSELRYDVVYSFATLDSSRGGWGYDISYLGLIRFRDSTTGVDNVTARIPEMLKKYMPGEKGQSERERYSFVPVSTVHSSMPEVHRMVLIMSVLAFVLLLVTALNYVLISVSALPRRAKGVGVHKCNGASAGEILGCFLCETFLVTAAALLLAVLLLYQFREVIEDSVHVSLAGLFTLHTLWIPLGVVIVLFLIAGFLPGRLFSHIPVSQVFRRYTNQRMSWKRPLLFVQFAGMAFIFGLLAVILMQYYTVMNQNLGYTPERVAYSYIRSTDDERALIKSNLNNLPMVEGVACSWNEMCNGYSGFGVYNVDGTRLLDDARTSFCDYSFLPMMGVHLRQGKFIDGPDQVIVNEEFLNRAHWKGNVLGRQIDIKWDNPRTIVGVIADYSNLNAYVPKAPILWVGSSSGGSSYSVRLKEPFAENLQALNKEVALLFPDKDAVFVSLNKKIETQYDSVRRFRNLVSIASLSILLIALMGLWGYTNDEVRRRSKEIAIRKVNGAEASSILWLLAKEIGWTALPGVLLGIASAWYIGGKWLEQFSESVAPGLLLFLGIAVAILLFIWSMVIVRTWSVANENPVKSIQSE